MVVDSCSAKNQRRYGNETIRSNETDSGEHPAAGESGSVAKAEGGEAMTPDMLRKFEHPMLAIDEHDGWPLRPASIGDLIRAAVADGLLAAPFGPTSVRGNNVWTELLVLTDAGRVACGLRPSAPVVPVAKQRELF